MNAALPLPYSNLTVLFGNLRHGVAAWGGRGMLEQVLLHLLYRRLGEIDRAIGRLAARFLAGGLWRIDRPRATPGGAVAVVRGGARTAARVWPRPFGWLMRMIGWQAGGYAGQLQHILQQPEMVALLRASPQAARILAPVCRMLALPPQLLRPVPEGNAASTEADRPQAPREARAKRARKPTAPIDWGRIPLPRGVLTAARKAGFKVPR